MGEALAAAAFERSRIPWRVYAPVGPHRDLLAYLVRRLIENGANSSFVARAADPLDAGVDAARRPLRADRRARTGAQPAHRRARRTLFAAARQFRRRRIWRQRRAFRPARRDRRRARTPYRRDPVASDDNQSARLRLADRRREDRGRRRGRRRRRRRRDGSGARRAFATGARQASRLAPARSSAPPI